MEKRSAPFSQLIIVRTDVPELFRSFESPLYVALILTCPAAVGIIVTWQLPPVSVQVVWKNVTFPVPETLDQVTVPLGDEYGPDIVAVQVTGVPTTGNI